MQKVPIFSYLQRNEDGSFSLLSKDERFALTCGSDNNIYLAEYHAGDKSQCWWIEKIK